MAQGLGKGLGSLIPKKTVNYGENPFKVDKDDLAKRGDIVLDSERIFLVSPSLIDFNPYQPRTFFSDSGLSDLAASIEEHGILQPLVVTRKKDGRFELIAGERRLRSSKLIKLEKVPVIIRTETNQKKLEFALIENLQRENLNPLETAKAYSRLLEEFNISQEEVAKKVGKARSSVANTLRLLALPSEAQNALAGGSITEAHAKQLLALESEAKQLAMLKKILRYNLTVADTDKEIKRIKGGKEKKYKDDLDKSREVELEDILSTKVEIKRRGRGGQLVIEFYSEGELNNLLTIIKK